jgi:hypothetical protein
MRAWSAGPSITPAFSLGRDVGHADEFFAHKRSILNLAFATIRAYQIHLKVLCDFLTDPVYEWDRICVRGFGRFPAQIITEFNWDRHAQNNEQEPTKRPSPGPICRDSSTWPTLRSNASLPRGAKAPSPPAGTPPFKTAYGYRVVRNTSGTIRRTKPTGQLVRAAALVEALVQWPFLAAVDTAEP